MEAIYGIHPIKQLLNRSDCPLERLVIATGRGGAVVKDLVSLAKIRNIPVELQPRSCLDALAGRNDHQGVIAFRKPFRYADLEDVMDHRQASSRQDLIVVLDGVMDPQNLGSIIRSAHSLGANGLVIPTDRAASVTPAAIKASAGSADQLPVARVTNIAQTLDDLKKRGYWIFGAETRSGQDLRDLDFDCPTALVMGSEARGIRPLVKKKCDFLVTISLANDFDSLNVSVAAGILLHGIWSQRGTRAVSA